MPPDHVDPNIATLAGYTELPLFVCAHDVTLGDDVVLRPFCNLYGCAIGARTKIGAYTEIGTGVAVGDDCKIGARTFIPPGVTIGDRVFVGPGVVFTNDKHPRAVGEWTCLPTTVCDDASIGAGSVVLPGVRIGRGAMIGAGTLVLRDVADGETYINKRIG